jgi:hypothetical protein
MGCCNAVRLQFLCETLLSSPSLDVQSFNADDATARTSSIGTNQQPVVAEPVDSICDTQENPHEFQIDVTVQLVY